MDLNFDRLFEKDGWPIDAKLHADWSWTVHVGGKSFAVRGELGSGPDARFDDAIPIFIDELPRGLQEAVGAALRSAYSSERIDNDVISDSIFTALNRSLESGPNLTSKLGDIFAGRASAQDLIDAASESSTSPYIVVWRE